MPILRNSGLKILGGLWDYFATVVANTPGEVLPLRADAYGWFGRVPSVVPVGQQPTEIRTIDDAIAGDVTNRRVALAPQR